jgi:hypothetical protein
MVRVIHFLIRVLGLQAHSAALELSKRIAIVICLDLAGKSKDIDPFSLYPPYMCGSMIRSIDAQDQDGALSDTRLVLPGSWIVHNRS